MPEDKDGYIIDDSILDNPISVDELLKYIEQLDEKLAINKDTEGEKEPPSVTK